jgi:hypothetical protein
MGKNKTQLVTDLRYIATAPYYERGRKWNGEDVIFLNKILYYISGVGFVEIPKGFVSDQGSIPPWLRSIVDDDDESLAGFFIHDFLSHRDCPIQIIREKTDQVLLDVIKGQGQNKFISWLTYRSVRLGRISIPYHYKDMIIDVEYADDVLSLY